MRAQEVEQASSGQTQCVFDEALIAIIGILDELRAVDDVSAWIRDGGLRDIGPQPLKANEAEDMAPLLARLSLDAQAPRMRFEEKHILAYWVHKGREALQGLNIPMLPEYRDTRGNAAQPASVMPPGDLEDPLSQ